MTKVEKLISNHHNNFDELQSKKDEYLKNLIQQANINQKIWEKSRRVVILTKLIIFFAIYILLSYGILLYLQSEYVSNWLSENVGQEYFGEGYQNIYVVLILVFLFLILFPIYTISVKSSDHQENLKKREEFLKEVYGYYDIFQSYEMLSFDDFVETQQLMSSYKKREDFNFLSDSRELYKNFAQYRMINYTEEEQLEEVVEKIMEESIAEFENIKEIVEIEMLKEGADYQVSLVNSVMDYINGNVMAYENNKENDLPEWNSKCFENAVMSGSYYAMGAYFTTCDCGYYFGGYYKNKPWAHSVAHGVWFLKKAHLEGNAHATESLNRMLEYDGLVIMLKDANTGIQRNVNTLQDLIEASPILKIKAHLLPL